VRFTGERDQVVVGRISGDVQDVSRGVVAGFGSAGEFSEVVVNFFEREVPAELVST
jgi:hypothetical protein